MAADQTEVLTSVFSFNVLVLKNQMCHFLIIELNLPCLGFICW
jgi:hypothetical protein